MVQTEGSDHEGRTEKERLLRKRSVKKELTCGAITFSVSLDRAKSFWFLNFLFDLCIPGALIEELPTQCNLKLESGMAEG